MPLADTHCHLFFESFDEDRAAVVERARSAGVERILTLGVDIPSSAASVEQARQYEGVFAAVGVHPNDAARVWKGESTLAELRALAQADEVVAIGEIGLDYYRDHTPPDLQRSVFVAQLLLAAELGLPVSIHIRDAVADALTIMSDWAAELRARGNALAARPGVWHAFGGTEAEAQKAIDAGFLLGIGGPVTFKNARERQRVVAALPLEAMVLETDAPFLAPHPHRGRRNEPAYVRLVAEKIAELHACEPEEVIALTSQNADKTFGWRDIV